MQKILVANRGEIALRIMRTIRKMDLLSVAVFRKPTEMRLMFCMLTRRFV